MKRILTILMVTTMVFVFAACQVTPEKPIVVKKDTERMVTQSADENNGTRLSELAIPKGRYAFENTGADGRLQIKVDAAISKPDVESIPIVKATMGGFSQKMVTGIFNYLFPDEKPLNQTFIPTKAEVEKDILYMQQRLADGSYAEQDFTEEEYRDLIAQRQAEYETAPETAPGPTVSDGTMRKQEVGTGPNEKGEMIKGEGLYLRVATEETPSDTTRFLQIITPDPDIGVQQTKGLASVLSYWDHSMPSYTTLGMVRTDGTDLPEIAQGKLTMSYEEAKALCDGLFAAGGIADDFAMGASFVVDDRGTGLVDGKWINGVYVEGPKAPAKNYAYQFYYTRKAFGVPVAVNTKNGGSSGEEFSIPWDYEYIAITVDNNGIGNITWLDPIAVDKIVQENTILKSFDEIIEIFETMIGITYKAYVDMHYGKEGRMEINVDDVQLCLLRIREQNGDETAGLLVPAWVFYGNNIAYSKEGFASYDAIGWGASSWPGAPFILLAINAVDGSIIDVAKGY